MYLDTELLLFFYLASKNPNVPHLGTGSLNLAPTESKNPYIIALMGLSYLTYYGTTFVHLTPDRNTLLFTYSLHQCSFYLPRIN